MAVFFMYRKSGGIAMRPPPTGERSGYKGHCYDDKTEFPLQIPTMPTTTGTEEGNQINVFPISLPDLPLQELLGY